MDREGDQQIRERDTLVKNRGDTSFPHVLSGNPFLAMSSHVYIMANKKHETLYIGVTADLKRRVTQHKESRIPGFTQKYNIHSLVYFEEHTDIRDAITREKQLKKWNRAWKIKLVERRNLEWRDLFFEL
jgi:putative endonuclease